MHPKMQRMHKNLQKTEGGEIFIKTKEPLEIVGVDIMTISRGKYLMVLVDYFTRIIKTRFARSKDMAETAMVVEDIIGEIGTPKKIISDARGEFVSKAFKELCARKGIEHHVIAADKHQSNGRVERSIRKIWQILRKTEVEKPVAENKIPELTKTINNTWNRANGRMPNEARENLANELLIKNNGEIGYNTEFRKLKREKFEIGDKVYVQELRAKMNLKETQG